MKTNWRTTDNWKEFKELIWRYESIILDDVNRAYTSIPSALIDGYGTIANKLTGFGRDASCTLCKAVDIVCTHCMWYVITGHGCSGIYQWKTYMDINDAASPEALVLAFKERAAYMRSIAGYVPEFKPSWRDLWGIKDRIAKLLKKKGLRS